MKIIPNQILLTLFLSISTVMAEMPAQSGSYQLSKTPSTPSRTVKPVVKPLLRDESSRWLELRGGPRFGMVFGKVRPGLDGSSQLDLKNDLDLDSVSVGPQFEVEMQVSPKWHASLAYAGNNYEGNTTSKRTIFYQSPSNPRINSNTQSNPASLPIGSTLQTKLDINTVSGLLRYDALATENLTLGPVIGVKAVFSEVELTLKNANTGVTIKRTQVIQEAIPLVGFETRLQLGRHFYVGASPVAFGWEKYVYLGGQGYVGVDFNKTFGMRLGLDVDFLSSAREAGSNYSTSSAQTAAFVEGVYGF